MRNRAIDTEGGWDPHPSRGTDVVASPFPEHAKGPRGGNEVDIHGRADARHQPWPSEDPADRTTRTWRRCTSHTTEK